MGPKAVASITVWNRLLTPHSVTSSATVPTTVLVQRHNSRPGAQVSGKSVQALWVEFWTPDFTW